MESARDSVLDENGWKCGHFVTTATGGESMESGRGTSTFSSLQRDRKDRPQTRLHTLQSAPATCSLQQGGAPKCSLTLKEHRQLGTRFSDTWADGQHLIQFIAEVEVIDIRDCKLLSNLRQCSKCKKKDQV